MKAEAKLLHRLGNTTGPDNLMPTFRGQGAGLISVIIPCYNQAHFLSEAIESALKQTHKPDEILVIDDGSQDNTREVASRYPDVLYIRQTNQGLSGARNTGIKNSKGDFLLFLDADDLLHQEAIEEGLQALEDHPECAFVYGYHRMVDQAGVPIVTRQPTSTPDSEKDCYAWLLLGNHIGMHATVLYRRSVFTSVGGFNNRLTVCEDYDLYLRITRDFPVAYHDHLVADYRLHSNNMSRDLGLMLEGVLDVLRLQGPYIRGNDLYRKMYQLGVKNWVFYYSKQAALDLAAHFKAKSWKQVLKALLLPTKYLFFSIFELIRKATGFFAWHITFMRRRVTETPLNQVSFGDFRRLDPLGSVTLSDPEKGIDGNYIDHFMNLFREDVKGNVFIFGGGSRRNIDSSLISGIEKNGLHTLVSGQPAETYDCLLLPHTLHLADDPAKVLDSFLRILKPGGILMATLPGLYPVNFPIEGFRSFTKKAAQRLFSDRFPDENVHIEVYGNVLCATAFLHRLPAICLHPEEIQFQDDRYPVVIGVRAVKPGGQ